MIVKFSILLLVTLMIMIPVTESFAQRQEAVSFTAARVLTGDGPPADKLGKKGTGYIDNTSENCDYYLKTAKKTWTISQSLCADTGDLEVRVSTLEQFVQDVMNGIANLISWNSLKDVPADIADGDDDTQLTETEVDAFVANNGFSTGSHTVDTDTQLTETEVDAFVANNGFSTGSHTVDTNTNAATLCTTGEYLDGDGTCKTLPTGSGDSSATSTIYQTFAPRQAVGIITFDNPKTIMQQSFSTSKEATVIVNSNVVATEGINFIAMYVDGTKVVKSSDIGGGPDFNFPVSTAQSWSGILPAGSHTVEIIVETNGNGITGNGVFCPNDTDDNRFFSDDKTCSMYTLVLE